MRTIKFRGKRKGTPNEWLFGDLNHVGGDVYVFSRDEDTPLNSPDWFEVIPETVGQFISTQDEVDLYEGDIVEASDGNEYVLTWCIHSFETRLKNGCFNKEKTVWFWKMAVIGNIHDNPELLK